MFPHLPRQAKFWGTLARRMSHSLTSLRRWGVTDKDLPDVKQIKHIHVYDFDNTLFASPLPNAQLWNGQTIGMLQSQDTFANGGWWHDSRFLACTGEGVEKEEAKAWDGWWNEQIVNLVELTMQQRDALNVLLTGRSEGGFTDLLQRIVKSKGLDFHLISLRPKAGPANQKFSSTGVFKRAFLEDVMNTYRDAVEIRIYEDRPHHVSMFRNFFHSFNQSLSQSDNPEVRRPIHAEVIEVAENATNLDPVAEAAEVQRMINAHNIAFRDRSLPPNTRVTSYEIKRQVLFTGYLISPTDTDRLLSAANLPVSKDSRGDLRTLANNIMITPRPCPSHVLSKIGGLGKKVTWRVVGFGSFDDKVWAARVEPVPTTETVQCEGSAPPHVVLAVSRNARPMDANRITVWHGIVGTTPLEFETVIGEKVLLRIDEERPHQNGTRLEFHDSRGFKRAQPFDDEFPALGSSNPNRPRPNGSGGPSVGQHNRGGGAGGSQRSRGANHFQNRGGGRGGGGFAGGRGAFQRSGAGGGPQAPRGRGRGGGYRSLDDGGPHPNARRRGDHGANGAAGDGGLTY